MNQAYIDPEVLEWEGYCTYSSIVEGFLHLISRHNFPPTLEE
jgi:hypothetical protein